MNRELYNKILFDYKLALEFKKSAIDIYRRREAKSIEELSEIFHEVDGKYTLEDGKEFISSLSFNNRKWYFGSVPNSSNSLSFINIKEGKIVLKINRVQYFN